MTNASQVAFLPRHSTSCTEANESPVALAQVVELPRRDAMEREGAEPQRLGSLLAWSASMKNAFDRIRRIAPTDLPVMIEGPSGTGKELAARAVHDASPRAAAPFLALNCGALSATIIEAELFGHVKGSFTGAMADKKGAFEACDGGTLFLDEIGELPLELQPKLLRVLETMTIRKVGDVREIPVNVRIVAATHRDLADLVAEGKFREDLYHRLVVLNVLLPALAERPEDIIGLAQEFAPAKRFTEAAHQTLLGHGWSGNVRELKNTIVRACVMTDSDVLDAADIELLGKKRAPVVAAAQVATVDTDTSDLHVDPESQRERYIQLLRDCKNNRAEAARRLGIARSTFHAQLRRLGIPLKFDAETN